MKKSTIIWLSVIGFLLLMSIFMYNGMVEKNEKVTEAWQQVENVYQRRLDLIPNIVQTVQGQADFERSTLEAVVNARANATKVTISPDKLDEQSIKQYQAAQGELSSALSRLLMVSENYPELKANEGFSDLRTQLEGSENRITTERQKFNAVCKEYNASIQKFPRNIFANLFGFEKRAYFEMQEGADKAPAVKFDFKGDKK